MATVIFQPYGTKLDIQEGKTLLQAAQEGGIHIPAYCGGEKVCGKCRVIVVEGNFEKHQIFSKKSNLSLLTETEEKFFTGEELEKGYRLACNAVIQGDVVVEVPAESQLQPQVILERGKEKETYLKPAVKAYNLKLNKATLEDNRDDLTRVKDALKEYKELDENIEIDFAALNQLSQAIRSGDWEVTVYILYRKKIIGVVSGKVETAFGVAVDIGTTTVVAYLCDLSTGAVLQTGSFMNPQVGYGDDIISRVSFCVNNEGGVKKLQKLLMDKLNSTLEEMVSRQGIKVEDICEGVLVFNTVMEFIALGIMPETLGFSPFVSPASQPFDIAARDIGINIMPGGNIHTLPSVAGFVGADNVAVLIAEEPYYQEKMKLIIDIGTNSEICLGNKEKLYSTSCATGPALEGAQIKCGMRAANGAIEAVKINPVTLEPAMKIIGDEDRTLRPIGICGSGIIDVVVEMALTGIIEPDGRFSKIESERIRVGEDGKKEYVLYFKKSEAEQDVVVNMADIRAVQLAKSALYAGAKILMQECNISKVDEIVLAGAFGSYIDRENALKLGMIPDCEISKITVSGNAAGLGARIALINIDKREEAKEISRTVEFIETATKNDFSKAFTEAMVIPHKKDTFTMNKSIEFPCSALHNSGDSKIESGYLYKDMSDLINNEENFISRELLEKIINDNSRDDLSDDVIDIPSPFSILASLISPVKLYSNSRKQPEVLEKLLESIFSYTKEAIEKGVKIISFADSAGVMELVGEKYYYQFSGKANYDYFSELKLSLKKTLIHICGKTSYSMEKAGLMIARPYRTVADKEYMEILTEESASSKVKYVGHACINKKQLDIPVIYRMELVDKEKINVK